MAHVAPLEAGDVPELADALAAAEETLGFVPNSLLTLARRPEIARGFVSLAMSVHREGLVPSPLKRMVAEVASTAAGCRYCQAHGAVQMDRAGIDPAKAAAVWEYESSPLFDDAERAALDLARHASLVPNAATEDHFTSLHEHFSEEQIVELVAVIAMFGFLNRWNDTMATDLEPIPLELASDRLAGTDWSPGKHGRASVTD